MTPLEIKQKYPSWAIELALKLKTKIGDEPNERRTNKNTSE